MQSFQFYVNISVCYLCKYFIHGYNMSSFVLLPCRCMSAYMQILILFYPVQAPPHARSASTGTSSECTPAGSSSPQSNVDVYDVKFQGMDAVCIDNSHPQENGIYSCAQLLCTKRDMSACCILEQRSYTKNRSYII